jgi:catechol 2,3-dioxygenase-like lactoylglutathione lyase family enzyme
VLGSASLMAFIPARDLSVARAFYAGTLGLRLAEETPVALVFDAGGTHLRVTAAPDLRPQPFTIAGWAVPDIYGTVRALRQAGVSFTRYDGMGQDGDGVWTAPGGHLVAWFTDPDGNTLSLTQF